MRKLTNKSGFTLIEIIVVLIIVGILAAIALPNLFSNVNKSRAQEAMAQISTIRANIEACEAGHYGTEATCVFGAATPLGNAPTTANFNYALSTPPVNGKIGYTLTATGTNAAATGVVTLTEAQIADPGPAGAPILGCTGLLLGAC